jgi:rRNA methylases
MIPLSKLAKLAPRHRMRKAALVLGEVERGLMEKPEAAGELRGFLCGLGELLAREPESPESVLAAASALVGSTARGTELDGLGTELLRAVDALRHALISASGQAPADWDLLDPNTGKLDPRSRSVRPGMRVYLEDLRSPFNVGSIFRTADAFGVEELLLSPACADPGHPRALRSAMGSIDLVPWRRLPLSDFPVEAVFFALELGGQAIEDFDFPERAVAILGSEELGISREARDKCVGTVSIPMSGAKASLNVAVAFGIMMYAWSRHLHA